MSTRSKLARLADPRDVFLMLAFVLVAMPSFAQSCGSLRFNYGPFDYRTDQNKLPVVEQRHFTPRIESLIGGETTVAAGPDIEYTLGAFPNHARALAAVMRIGLRDKTNTPKELKRSVDCHFERALRFRANDVVVRMIFAQWLGKTARRDEALRQLAQVDPRGEPLTIQNLGLLYADLGDYESALKKAYEAQSAGFQAPLLRGMLERAGRWVPPPAAGDAASAADVASAPAQSSRP